jgi:hypothetical protein
VESKTKRWLSALGIILVFSLSTSNGASIQRQFLHSSAQSASASSGPSFLDLGFGPNTLQSASLGVPIYTVNDSLWVHSLLDQTVFVSLIDPTGSSYFGSPISSLSAVSIHEFSATDQQGTWNLTVSLPNSTSYYVPISFEVPNVNSSVVSLTEYSIQNGQINLGFASDPSSAYNVEACLTANFGNGTAYLSIPASFGNGQIGLNLETGPGLSTVTMPSTPAQPFSFWYNLYYSYGFSGTLSNETVSRDLNPSTSSSAYVNSSGARLLSLSNETHLRPGRYLIRANFDSGTSYATAETRALLLTNGDWFWLGGCSPFSVTQTAFTKQVSLDQDPNTWPKFIYVMYDVGGVDAYSISSLQINLARIDFFGTPNNVKLSYLSYSIANNSDAQASGIYSGTIYVIAKSFPILLTITPTFGSEVLRSQSIRITQAFSDSVAYIPVGELSVTVLNNSKPDTGSQVKISTSQGANVASPVDGTGVASFYLPPGDYNVTVAKGAISKTGNASVAYSNETIVEFSFTSSALPSYLAELLAVPLFLGLILNVWIWVIAPRRGK